MVVLTRPAAKRERLLDRQGSKNDRTMENIRVTVVIGSDGSDDSVVKLLFQLFTSNPGRDTDNLGKSPLVKVGPRLLGVLNMSKDFLKMDRTHSIVVSSRTSLVGGISSPE